jgi:hypothetical protein
MQPELADCQQVMFCFSQNDVMATPAAGHSPTKKILARIRRNRWTKNFIVSTINSTLFDLGAF